MGMLTPLAIKIGSLTWMPKLLPGITWLDKLLQRITRGHWSLLRIAGLPNLMLTVVGRKSGAPRSTPLLCVPYCNGYLIAGSNFGGPTAPAWVANVRAAHRVTLTVGAEQHEATAQEITGEEREVVWNHMLTTWPNYARYAARTSRTIPVFFLNPTS
jgi:deazaflavin-dependent oxidoreductase (nitroreductase family)